MKHIFKLALIIIATVVYSCNSNSKKQTVDSIANSNPQRARSLKNYTFLNDGTVHADLVFPNFVAKVHNFPSHGADEVTDPHQLIFNKNKTKLWGLFAIAKSDTIGLQGYDFYNTIELIPDNKTDRFKVSYFYRIFIYDLEDDTPPLIIMPDYRPLKDSSIYFFRLPKHVANYSDYDGISAVKKKLKLRDTTATNSDGSVVGGFVTYKNKKCRIDADNYIYLKIEQFNSKGDFLEKKFVKIELMVREDVED